MKSNSRVYGYDCFNIRHNDGLVASIGRLAASPVLFVPDDSIIPAVAPILGGNVDISKLGNVSQTYDALFGLFKYNKVAIHPEVMAKMEEVLHAEISTADRKGVSAISDKSRRCLERLVGLGSVQLVDERKAIYDAVYGFVVSLDAKLDFRTKEEIAADPKNLAFKTYALALTLAMKDSSRPYGIMTRDDVYLRVMDATIGIGYFLGESAKKEGVNPVAKNLNFPRLSILQCDITSNVNQPYEIVRGTAEPGKQPVPPRRWTEMERGSAKAEITDYIRTGLQGISALLSRKVIPETRRPSNGGKADETSSEEREPAQRLSIHREIGASTSKSGGVTPGGKQEYSDNRSAGGPAQVVSTGKPDKEPSPEPAEPGTKKSLVLDNGALMKLYDGLKVDPTRLEELDTAGLLEKKIGAYEALAQIARTNGAEPILQLIGSDAAAIRAYLETIRGSRIAALTTLLGKEQSELDGYRGLLDGLVRIMATGNGSSPLEAQVEIQGGEGIQPEPPAQDPAHPNGSGQILYDNLCQLLGRTIPPEGERTPKKNLRHASGLSTSGVTYVIKKLKREGEITDNDYNLNRHVLTFNASKRFLDAFGNALVKQKPKPLKANS